MAVKKYSEKVDGNKQLAANFRVSEFACSDGSDTVLIDDKLVPLLQSIRNHFGRLVHITSAYRTLAYNRLIGSKESSICQKQTVPFVANEANSNVAALAPRTCG